MSKTVPCCRDPINRHAANPAGTRTAAVGGCLVEGCPCTKSRREAAATRPRRVTLATDSTRDATTIISLDLREVGAIYGFSPSKARYFAGEIIARLEAAGFTIERRSARSARAKNKEAPESE